MGKAKTLLGTGIAVLHNILTLMVAILHHLLNTKQNQLNLKFDNIDEVCWQLSFVCYLSLLYRCHPQHQVSPMK